MNAKEINWDSLEIDGINYNDAPEFCDAYFCYGEYMDGTPLEDAKLEELSLDGVTKYEHINKTVY